MLLEIVDEELASSLRIVIHFRSNTSKGVLRLTGGIKTSGRWYSR